MLILGIDTSGPNGSIALVRFVGDQARTLDLAAIEGGTFSAQLIPQLSRVLSNQRLSKQDIDAFAVASGPGSFTGLRVGLAAVKALAETLHKPIAAVSLLEAIAFDVTPCQPNQNGAWSRVLVALDARRNEAFVGEYELTSDMPKQISEQLCTRDELVALAKRARVFSPDEAILGYLRNAGETAVDVTRPDAAVIARAGFKKIAAGDTVSALDLDANYIRRSDAEMKAISVLK